MEVIPVVDLRGGRVVHAQRGQRDRYPALRSRLCAGNAAEEVIRGFRRLFPFPRIYAADLDAIEGTGDHAGCLFDLAWAFPDIEFWVDAGFQDLTSVRRYRANGPANIRAVMGSESLRTDAGNRPWDHGWQASDDGSSPLGSVILSLDFRDGAYVGPPALLDHAALWPDRVIAMTLARVGTGQGPDLALLRSLRIQVPTGRLYAAGGIRDVRDLETLSALGIDGVLVATALHEGRISRGDLESLAPAQARKTDARP